MSDDDEFVPLSLAFFEFEMSKSAFEIELEEAGFKPPQYSKFWFDDYDNSIEFGKVENDWRINEAIQRIIVKNCFSKCYVNHQDGWETHYNWHGKEFVLSRGWRRRYVIDPSAKTTRQIGADPADDRGYYEISYWPEGWGKQDWLETGYMRLVPDKLETAVT